jgi:hypothetical protein
MFSAGPPRRAEDLGGEGGSLWLSRAGRRVFDGSSNSALDPMLRVYLSDMVRPYRLTLREDLLQGGSGQSYGEMAGALMRETVPGDQPVDLIVLAFAIHDVVPGRSTASHLSHICPGGPMAFAVCDQGVAAPFTGLRLMREYARTAGCRRTLLVVVEQATLHYDGFAAGTAPAGTAPAGTAPAGTAPAGTAPAGTAPAGTAPAGAAEQARHAAAVPKRHAAVTLLFGESGPGRLEIVRQHAGVAAAQVRDLLTAELDALSAGRTDVTLVAGHGLTWPGGPAGAGAVLPGDTPVVDQVLMVPPGQPSTGVWWALAGALTGWAAAGRKVLLADYDAQLRYLCVASIEIP